jgi:8-oxo-dGTP pyrophosphatase MutT (NUDIX family)
MKSRWKPGVTVAAVVEYEGKFLLVEEQTPSGLRLNNPAGHLEAGESLIEACIRETREETAYQFTPQALVGSYLWRAPATTGTKASDTGAENGYLRFAFCGTLGVHYPDQALDSGIERALWLSIDALRSSVERHRSPLVLQCIEDYMRGCRYPLELLTTLTQR